MATAEEHGGERFADAFFFGTVVSTARHTETHSGCDLAEVST